MWKAVRDRSEILLMVKEHESLNKDIFGKDKISFSQLFRNISQYAEDGVFTALEKLEEEGKINMESSDRHNWLIEPIN